MEAQSRRAGPILVVDDDLAICDILQFSLESLGFHVITAHNGMEALTIINNSKNSPSPCAVVLDMMMPIMDGGAFLQARREDVALSRIPVIVVTAFPNVKAEGANALLKKPVRLEDLCRELAKYCNHARGLENKSEDEGDP
jgi:CheY-like chemotaxis protein